MNIYLTLKNIPKHKLLIIKQKKVGEKILIMKKFCTIIMELKKIRKKVEDHQLFQRKIKLVNSNQNITFEFFD